MHAKGPVPDIERLADCARLFASLLGVPAPVPSDVRAVIEDVLYTRDAVEAVRLGIITETEAVNLLLAHLHTLLTDNHRHPTAGEPWNDQRLAQCVHEAMFGVRHPSRS